MQTGTTYGYKAVCSITAGLASKKGYSNGDLITALQSDLALKGLLCTKYKVTGKGTRLNLALELTPAKGFFSTTSVKTLVDEVIQQQTGSAPSWSMDPCCCVVRGACPATLTSSLNPANTAAIAASCCPTAETMALISPAGKNAFAATPNSAKCLGSGAAVVQLAPSSSAASDIYEAGQSVAAGASAVAQAAAGPIEILVLLAIAIGALYVFVFAKGS